MTARHVADDNDPDTMPDSFFQTLPPESIEEFREWAREHHKPGNPVSGMWHPVVRDECRRIDAEQTR